MIKAIVSDFSKTILFPKDPNFEGSMNSFHEKMLKDKGNYDLWEYFYINNELLELYKKYSSTVKIYIFTTKYIQEYPQLKQKLEGIFDKTLIAADLGINKKLTDAYYRIAEEINLKPEEVIFIDDSDENIFSATKAGMNTIKYTNFADVEKSLKKLLIINN